jgi:hypothetical protein
MKSRLESVLPSNGDQAEGDLPRLLVLSEQSSRC